MNAEYLCHVYLFNGYCSSILLSNLTISKPETFTPLASQYEIKFVLHTVIKLVYISETTINSQSFPSWLLSIHIIIHYQTENSFPEVLSTLPE